LIHPTAIVDAAVEIAADVEIGPYTIIGPGVVIEAGCTIGPHVVLRGQTRIGAGTRIFQFASVGEDPQDKKYAGEETALVIGQRNVIREYATVHRGTAQDRGETRIGDDNLLMAYTHVAHDCSIGNHVIMANVATLAGHVEVGDRASIGGLVAIHQFCRIGTFSYIGGVSGIGLDVPPYVILAGTRNRTRISGVNKVGLKRNGFSRETIRMLDTAFRIIFRTPNLLMKDAIEVARKEFPECPEVQNLVKFFEDSKRGVVKQTVED
jgi:UDP-N-acetylglucosamine acyltransferase